MERETEFHPVRSKYVVITADILLPAAIILGVFALWWSVFRTGLFAIRTVICTVDHVPCEDRSMLAELSKYRGQNIFTLDTAALTRRLESADYTVREAVVTRSLPGTLTVSLQSVYPVVAMQVSGQGTWAVFDGELRLIGTRDSYPNVPTVVVQSAVNLAVGKVVTDQSVRSALETAKAIGAGIPSVKSIELTDPATIRLTLASGQYVLLTTEKPVEGQIRLLQAVLKDDTIVQGVAGIDVRFNQPVLKSY